MKELSRIEKGMTPTRIGCHQVNKISNIATHTHYSGMKKDKESFRTTMVNIVMYDDPLGENGLVANADDNHSLGKGQYNRKAI